MMQTLADINHVKVIRFERNLFAPRICDSCVKARSGKNVRNRAPAHCCGRIRLNASDFETGFGEGIRGDAISRWDVEKAARLPRVLSEQGHRSRKLGAG